jgi:hypothetical protein
MDWEVPLQKARAIRKCPLPEPCPGHHRNSRQVYEKWPENKIQPKKVNATVLN